MTLVQTVALCMHVVRHVSSHFPSSLQACVRVCVCVCASSLTLVEMATLVDALVQDRQESDWKALSGGLRLFSKRL